ncbi:MAG: glycosyltransferase family 39 protein [Chloroflexi bacterium]|nr:glycosyltransferase family 39 protein [Chloroflexota bacterium]
MKRVLLETGQFSSGHWPAYPVTLAAGYGLWPDGLLGGRLLQAVYGLTPVAVALFVGRAAFGPRAGLIAGGLCAGLPLLLIYNDYLLTETLYAAVLSAAFAAAQVGMRRLNASRGIGWGVLLGVLFGAAALTRGTLGAALLPVMLVYIVWRYKARAVVYAVAALVALVVTISPWLIYNAQTYGWATLSTRTGRDLYAGNNPWADGSWGSGVAYLDDPASPLYGLTPIEQAQRGTQEAVAWIVRNPVPFAGKGVQAVRYLYELPRQYAYSYREGYYGQSPIARLGWLMPTAVIGVSFAAVMVLFVIGSVAHRAKPAVQLCAVLLLAITGSAFLTYGDNRFLVPFVPLICVPAAAVIAHPRKTFALIGPRARAVTALLIVLLCVNWAVLAIAELSAT